MIKTKEYGIALYELAQEEGVQSEIKTEFSQIVSLLQDNKDFIKLLSNPRISKQERLKVIDETFGNKIQPYLLYLVKILAENLQVDKLPLVYNEYELKYYDENNILPVTVTSAVELTPSQIEKLKLKLEGKTNKNIVLVNKIEKDCIGGIRLEYRGQMVDASIKNRFKKLQQEIKNADYSQAEAN